MANINPVSVKYSVQEFMLTFGRFKVQLVNGWNTMPVLLYNFNIYCK